MNINIHISIGCLFLNVVGPITHLAVQTNYNTTLKRAIALSAPLDV